MTHQPPSWMYAIFFLLCFAQPNIIQSSEIFYGTNTNNSVTVPVPAATIQHKIHKNSESNIGLWNVTDANSTCILLKGLIKLSINYTDTSNNSKTGDVIVPASAKASGSCYEQYIILSWQEESTLEYQEFNNTLTLVFQANDKSRKKTMVQGTKIPTGKFAIVEITAVISKNERIFPNATNPGDRFMIGLDELVLLPTTLTHSYACYATVALTSPINNQITVLLQNFQIEAFRKVNKVQSASKFSTAEHCAADEISSGSLIVTVIISILSIVFVALAVAAVATYVLKRRQASASDYESM